MNNIYCVIGFTLLISSILMNLFKNEKYHNDFTKLLNNNQITIYKNIVKERINIYIYGLFLGLILGLLFIYYNSKTQYKTCKFISIVMITKLFFYYIYPKSTYMLKHLTNREQVDKWTDLYVYMKKIWMSSLVISFISYYLIVQNF